MQDPFFLWDLKCKHFLSLGEAGVPFFHASGSEFDEIFVGTGAKRVRQLFGKKTRNFYPFNLEKWNDKTLSEYCYNSIHLIIKKYLYHLKKKVKISSVHFITYSCQLYLKKKKCLNFLQREAEVFINHCTMKKYFF